MSRRPSMWQYMSFSRPSSRFDERRGLPLSNAAESEDLYEKPNRRSGSAGQYRYSPPPYSNGYGTKPTWKTAGSRSRWLKVGAVVGLVLLVLYVLTPGEQAKSGMTQGGQHESEDPHHSKPLHHDASGVDMKLSGQATLIDPEEEAELAEPDVKTPSTSPATSTTMTTKCKQPYDSSKTLLQYALMVDAGSTGSRIHVYRFNNCGPTPELEDEVFKMTEPKKGGSGLSSFDADAEGAAASLDVLLDVAVASVPAEYRSCSPIAVKATAGLRKLGTTKSEKILQAVRHRLETIYPFPVLSAEKGGVEVMDGKDEGVYAWITTNYLLGNIGGPAKNPTAAVFDLGGGSTQIVFEPTFPLAAEGGMPHEMKEGDHKYALNFGGRNFTLYQHSYLGYGLMAARENLHQLVLLDALEAAEKATSGAEKWSTGEPLENPCIQPGQSVTVDVALPTGFALGEKLSVQMVGVGPGPSSSGTSSSSASAAAAAAAAGAQCLSLAERTLKKEAECKIAPCAFHGVYQPSLAETFAREEVYLFSYFYDRLSALGLPDELTLSTLKSVTEDVCAGEASGAWKRFGSGAVEELKERSEYCLDLSFMLSLLTSGYEMPMQREVKIAKKIGGNELGWCLGASLPLLSGEGFTCRVKEVP